MIIKFTVQSKGYNRQTRQTQHLKSLSLTESRAEFSDPDCAFGATFLYHSTLYTVSLKKCRLLQFLNEILTYI